jgi:UPF0755 protein
VLVGQTLAALGALGLPVAGLFAWAAFPSSVPGVPLAVHVSLTPAGSVDRGELVRSLAAQGVLTSGWLHRAYWTLRGLDIEPGPHLLFSGLSPQELADRLARSPARDEVSVALPEGFNHVQMGERLENQGVASAEAFVKAARDPALLAELRVPRATAEGYLFPATYRFHADTPPHAVVRKLVAEARARWAELERQQEGSWDAAKVRYGLDEVGVLTLASIVEKEARVAEERPLIASVYLNRLTDPSFEPRGRLQADPTAAYGCVVLEPPPASCARAGGRVTPELLRDASNPYNTYRRAGLPPGPIANPGVASIRAVLQPAETDYLFFYATGGGRHTFSRTFAEHNRLFRGPRPSEPHGQTSPSAP